MKFDKLKLNRHPSQILYYKLYQSNNYKQDYFIAQVFSSLKISSYKIWFYSTMLCVLMFSPPHNFEHEQIVLSPSQCYNRVHLLICKKQHVESHSHLMFDTILLGIWFHVVTYRRFEISASSWLQMHRIGIPFRLVNLYKESMYSGAKRTCQVKMSLFDCGPSFKYSSLRVGSRCRRSFIVDDFAFSVAILSQSILRASFRPVQGG